MIKVVDSVVTAIGGYYGPDDSRVFPKVYSTHFIPKLGAYNTSSPTLRQENHLFCSLTNVCII